MGLLCLTFLDVVGEMFLFKAVGRRDVTGFRRGEDDQEPGRISYHVHSVLVGRFTEWECM